MSSFVAAAAPATSIVKDGVATTVCDASVYIGDFPVRNHRFASRTNSNSTQKKSGRLIPRVVSEFNKNDVFMGLYSLAESKAGAQLTESRSNQPGKGATDDNDTLNNVTSSNSLAVSCDNTYEGNTRFRKLLVDRRQDYLQATSRRAKGRILKEIIKTIHDRGGRFLELVTTKASQQTQIKNNKSKNEVWKLVDTATVLHQKIKMFLREVGPVTKKRLIMQRMEAQQEKGFGAVVVTTESATKRGTNNKNSIDPPVKITASRTPKAPLSPNNVIDIEKLSVVKDHHQQQQQRFQQAPSSPPPSNVSDTQSTTSSVEELSAVAGNVQGMDSSEQQVNAQQQLFNLLLGGLLSVPPNQPTNALVSPTVSPTPFSVPNTYLQMAAAPQSSAPLPPPTLQGQQLLEQLVECLGSTLHQQRPQTCWDSTIGNTHASPSVDGAALAALSLLIGTLNGR